MSSISSVVKMDYKKYLSNHDVAYYSLTDNDYDGLPVGNGVMGGVVQTRPYGIKLLVNRADVLGCNSYTDAPTEDIPHPLHHSNCCGWMEIDFGINAFPMNTFQGLQYHNGLGTIKGGGIEIKIIACNDSDTIVFHVNDNRGNNERQSVKLRLRMMRPPVMRSGSRPLEVISEIKEYHGDIFLTQVYTEPGIEGIPNSKHYCASAIMLSVKGENFLEKIIEMKNERTIEISTNGCAEYDVYLTSAASLDEHKDVIALTLASNKKVCNESFDFLVACQERWWSEFWERSYVCLRSTDGKAEYLERAWVGWLYSMACCSRSWFVPHWNVLLWRVKGDWEMSWSGPRMWGWNLRSHYEGIPESNHPELMVPFINSYWNGIENGRWHALNIRGSKGTYLSETQFWNGVRTYQNINEKILSELRDYLLSRKKWDDLSEELKSFIRSFQGYDETLRSYQFYRNNRTIIPYLYHSHCFSTGANVAWRFYLVWEYTRDDSFLREKAYPLIKDMAEFYRNYPDVIKEKDGKYHIHNVHSHEPLWGAQDTMEELCAMKAMLILAYRLAKYLNTDTELQALWKEVAENLTPVPTTKHPDAIIPYGTREPERWVQGLKPYASMGGIESATPSRQWVHFDLATLETNDPELKKLALATLDAEPWYQDLNNGKATFCLSEIPTIAAMMGLSDKIRDWLPVQLSGIGWRDDIRLQKNNIMSVMSSSEWYGEITMEGLGRSAHNTQLALLQSIAAGPGLDPVIRVFPAWPTEWDACFKLAARRGFVVSSAIRNGKILFVEIYSNFGERCRIRNPWTKNKVLLFKNDLKKEWKKQPFSISTSGLIEFNTSPEDRFLLLPEDLLPEKVQADFDENPFYSVDYKEWIPE